MNNPLSKVDKNGFNETTVTADEARKKRDSAGEIAKFINSAVNKVLDQVEKGKIKPEQAAGALHDMLTSGADKYGNNTALSKFAQNLGSNYVVPARTKGTKYEGGLPVGEYAKTEAKKLANGSSWQEKALQMWFSHTNADGVLVWDDRVSISPGLNVNGSAIGTDKLDHIAHNGFDHFKLGLTPEEESKESDREERAGSGLGITGVYSRGDIAANKVGYEMYTQVDRAAREGGERPSFSFKSFDTSKLDENVNRNSYTPEVSAIVEKNTPHEEPVK